MRRRLTLKEPTQAKTNDNSPKDALIQRTERLAQQREVFRLRCAGYDNDEISDKMGISKMRVATLLADAFEDRKDERDKYVDRYLTMTLARYEALLKIWLPQANGYVEQVLDGNGDPVLDDRGRPKIRIYEPDPKAAKIVLEIMRDTREALGLNKVRVEHTGKDGGAIEYDIDIDLTQLTDEQIARLEKHPNLIAALRNISALGVGSGEAAEDSGEKGRPPTTH